MNETEKYLMMLSSKKHWKQTSRLTRNYVRQMAVLGGYYKMTIMFSKRGVNNERQKHNRLKEKSRPFVQSHLFKFILSSTTWVYFCSEELLTGFSRLSGFFF